MLIYAMGFVFSLFQLDRIMEQLPFGNGYFFSVDGFTRKRTAGHDFAGIGTIVVQLFVETFTGGFERFGSFLHRDVFRRGADGDGREMLIARGIFDLQDESRQSSELPWTVVYRNVRCIPGCPRASAKGGCSFPAGISADGFRFAAQLPTDVNRIRIDVPVRKHTIVIRKSFCTMVFDDGVFGCFPSFILIRYGRRLADGNFRNIHPVNDRVNAISRISCIFGNALSDLQDIVIDFGLLQARVFYGIFVNTFQCCLVEMF